MESNENSNTSENYNNSSASSSINNSNLNSSDVSQASSSNLNPNSQRVNKQNTANRPKRVVKRANGKSSNSEASQGGTSGIIGMFIKYVKSMMAEANGSLIAHRRSVESASSVKDDIVSNKNKQIKSLSKLVGKYKSAPTNGSVKADSKENQGSKANESQNVNKTSNTNSSNIHHFYQPTNSQVPNDVTIHHFYQPDVGQDNTYNPLDLSDASKQNVQSGASKGSSKVPNKSEATDDKSAVSGDNRSDSSSHGKSHNSSSVSYSDRVRDAFNRKQAHRIDYLSRKFAYKNHINITKGYSKSDWDKFKRYLNSRDAHRFGRAKPYRHNYKNRYSKNSLASDKDKINGKNGSGIHNGLPNSITGIHKPTSSDYWSSSVSIPPKEAKILKLEKMKSLNEEGKYLSPSDIEKANVASNGLSAVSAYKKANKARAKERARTGHHKYFNRRYNVKENPNQPNANHHALQKPGAQKLAIHGTNLFTRAAAHQNNRTHVGQFMKMLYQMLADMNARVANNRLFQNMSPHMMVVNAKKFHHHHQNKQIYKTTSKRAKKMLNHVDLDKEMNNYKIDSALDSLNDSGSNKKATVPSDDDILSDLSGIDSVSNDGSLSSSSDFGPEL